MISRQIRAEDIAVNVQLQRIKSGVENHSQLQQLPGMKKSSDRQEIEGLNQLFRTFQLFCVVRHMARLFVMRLSPACHFDVS